MLNCEPSKVALSAAIMSDICTFAVFGSKAVEQPAHTLMAWDASHTQLAARATVCVACSRHNETQPKRARDSVQ